MAVLGTMLLLLLMWSGIEVQASKHARIVQKPLSSVSSSSSFSSSSSSSSSSSLSRNASTINSDSVLVALLDSPYTELAEMADEASLLQMLEEMVAARTITIFAPKNSFIERNIDSDFRQFLLEPGNIDSLRALIRFHIIPERILASAWANKKYNTLAAEEVELSFGKMAELKVDLSTIVASDAIVRKDGVVHGIDRILIPKSVQNSYNRWKEGRTETRILAVLPTESPTPKTYAAQKAAKEKAKVKVAPSPPKESIYQALAPGPALAPAPAPGPSSGRRWFDGESTVNDFISTLVRYGGYNEIADLLVNLTSLAPELAKLVTEGYRMTILAPNDDAMAKLTADDLTAPGTPELIIFYHIIPEYQTEESFYNAVRRFGKVVYQTLRDPYKLVAQEEDGTVVFGEGKGNQAHLIDIDIFKDGRISVQGIDRVLSPPQDGASKKGRVLGEKQSVDISDAQSSASVVSVVEPSNQGWFESMFCAVFGRIISACK